MNSYKSFGDLASMTDIYAGVPGCIDFYGDRSLPGLSSYVSTIYSTDILHQNSIRAEIEQNSRSQMCYGIKGSSMKQSNVKKSKRKRMRDTIRYIKFLENKSDTITNRTDCDKKSQEDETSAINKKITWLRNLVPKPFRRSTPAPHEHLQSTNGNESQSIASNFSDKKRRKSKSKYERDARRWNKFKKAKTLKNEIPETDIAEFMEIPIHLQDEECVDISVFNEKSNTIQVANKKSASENTVTEKTRIVNRFYIGHKYMPIDAQVECVRHEVSENDKYTIQQLKQEISVLFKELEDMIQNI